MMNSILGALIGDAAGASLDFYYKEITEDIVLNAMTMPGNDNMCIGPGQITNNGELILTLWKSLNSLETSNISPILTIMKGYIDWYKSDPYDIRRTCYLAFDTLYDFFKGQNIHTLQGCKNTINRINIDYEDNGALIRATAIATWIILIKADIKTGIECAKEDARLSHPNIICQEINAIYVFAIIYLLQGKSPTEVIELTDDFVNTEITSEIIKYWYFEESYDIDSIIITEQIDHISWSFILSIYFLRNPNINYEEAIKITLMKGGDTTNNTTIVGGMVGAYHTIPEYMIRPVLDFDCTIDGKHHKRPAEYCVKNIIRNLI
jgi:ADP-ribosyl-[dinitrogen reductase] hydrolase